ncbi:MAG: HEAT repeat domain-containing protein [Nodosilinea sp.]
MSNDLPSSKAAASATVAGLGVGDFHDRWDQLRQVAGLGEAALADLIALLQDEDSDWEARWFAARALAELNHPEVISALVEALAAADDDDLRQAAAAALTHIGAPAIAALGKQMADPALRPIAVQALAQIPHLTTLPLLIEATADPRPSVRAIALNALGPFADPATWPVVERGLRDPAAAVRAAALRGLLSLRSHVPLGQLVETLTPIVADTDPSVAQQAIYALGRLTGLAATAVLLRQLGDASQVLQPAVVQALLWQDNDTALAGLITAWGALGRPAQVVLVQGLPSLTAQHLQTAVALEGWLRTLPKTPDHSLLRRHLVLALGEIGGAPTEPLLRSLLSDGDLGVRLHAEAALRQLQP